VRNSVESPEPLERTTAAAIASGENCVLMTILGVILVASVVAVWTTASLRLRVATPPQLRPGLRALAGPRWGRRQRSQLDGHNPTDLTSSTPYSPDVVADEEAAPPADLGSPLPATEAGARVVRVMMLGFSQSGKTTFLASMWRYFSLGAEGEIRFTTDESSARTLNGYVHQIMANKFQSGTGTSREWHFTVQARGLSENMVDTFTLTYVDYAGEDLDKFYEPIDEKSAVGEPMDPRVRRAIDEYDVIMGMLDGEKIADMMHDHTDLAYRLWLEKLFYFIASQPDKTVHLVLTKHDLLQEYTLGEIKEKLLKNYASFRQFYNFRRNGKKRLIAVAAFGTKGFVHRTPEGKMELNPNADWEPDSVERPLVCTLPDILGAELEKWRKSTPSNRDAAQHKKGSWDSYSQVLYWVASLFVLDRQVVMAGPVELSATATVAALAHLAKLLAQQESRIPGSRLPWRRRPPTAATSEVSRALERIIATWAERSSEFARDKRCTIVLDPSEAEE
jgi:Double-GTPase 1